VAEGGGEPTLAVSGRADQGQIVVGVDPSALDKLLEQRPVEAARGAIVDVFDAGLLAQLGDPQPRGEPLVLPPGRFAVEEHAEPFQRAEAVSLAAGGDLVEGLGHSMKAESVKPVGSRMFEQGVCP
jgi:hypothetical protein